MQSRSHSAALVSAFAQAIAVCVLASPASADVGDRGAPDASTKAPNKHEKPKKVASRAAKHKGKTARREDTPARPCLGETVALDRVGLEPQTLRLVDCKKRPVDRARVALSVLARPWGAPKPDHIAALSEHARAARPLAEIAPGVRLLDPGLLTRVEAITRHFGGKPISIVSGYRPRSEGSQHQHARALDLRVVGVRNEELVAFCKTLRDTGCGYYPNSSFVHVDVRNPGTGSVTWIDASGPGEGPHYVTRWPLPPEEADHASLPAAPGPSSVVAPAREPLVDPWDELDDHPSTPGLRPAR